MIDDSKLMEIDESYSGTKGRTLYQRMFSKIGEGSMRGAIFNLCCIAIGAGTALTRLLDSPQSLVVMRYRNRHYITADGRWICILEPQQSGYYF